MIPAMIAMIIGNIKFKIILKKCLIVDSSTNIELFEYKGKTYDRNKFIQLLAESLENSGLSKKSLRRKLEEYQSGLINSKTPDLDLAFIEAYKMVIE